MQIKSQWIGILPVKWKVDILQGTDLKWQRTNNSLYCIISTKNIWKGIICFSNKHKVYGISYWERMRKRWNNEDMSECFNFVVTRLG